MKLQLSETRNHRQHFCHWQTDG